MKHTLDDRITLGTNYDGCDPTGWIVSEKLDGCRCIWDGVTLWSRGGRPLTRTPPDFLADLPVGQLLDGELWAGRGRYEEARIAIQSYKRKFWTDRLRFMVFDAPQVNGTWIERMATVNHTIFSRPVDWSVCSSREDMWRLFHEVTQGGGEGLMLRNPDTVGYERGRTRNLLKVK